MSTLIWGDRTLRLKFDWSEDEAVHVAAVDTGDLMVTAHPTPLVELLTVGDGHARSNDRLTQTSVGSRLRYLSHVEETNPLGPSLTLRLGDPETGMEVSVSLEGFKGASAFRVQSTILNPSTGRPQVLRAVTSWVQAFGGVEGSASLDEWRLLHGESDWLAEQRWSVSVVRDLLPALRSDLTDRPPRSAFSAASYGTWSTGGALPVAGVISSTGVAWLWDIEHNGGWRWEVGESLDDGYFAISGPTDMDHQWSAVLEPGTFFTTVPAVVAVGRSFEGALASLTSARRAVRRPHPDNVKPALVYNDYMNTLRGDPTSAKLLPLVEAAAAIGAEVFCIDAGWYDEKGGDWWGSIGEWVPSSRRFPAGIGEVTGRIRELGLVAGLWMEPEVMGIESPASSRLPDTAFMTRHGQRVVEEKRYHLDLRSEDARRHLDDAVDRLVRTLDVGYFKFDYNINPGAGSDRGSTSVGDALLDHNRAHLAWLDGIGQRHPALIMENCASGAMRADASLLSRFQLQSTSDQQDPLLYPPISAGSPISMLPEQAANWCYPQPEMTLEEIAFVMSNGLLSRMYLSGFLDRLDGAQWELVADAVSVFKRLRGTVAESFPLLPLGLPGWTSRWIASGVRSGTKRYITVWDREGGDGSVHLDLGAAVSRDQVSLVYPRTLPEWCLAVGTDGVEISNTTGTPGARTFEIALS
jgi:alpha-galactosidase